MADKSQNLLAEATCGQDLAQIKNWLADGAIQLKNCAVEHTVQPPDALSLPALEKHMLVMGLNPGESQFSRFAGLEYNGVGYDQSFFIVPAGTPSEFVWDQDDKAMIFDIDPQALTQTAIETDCLVHNKAELKPIVFEQDEQMTRIAMLFLHEIQTGGEGGLLFSESLLTCLNIHLLRYYCALEAKPKDYSGGLAPYRLRQVLEYIDANLADGETSLDAMAKIANLSSYYFACQFKQSTGIPPHQYVTRQRVEKAKRLLKQQLSIAQVGLECGFSNQSHFGRVFRKMTNTTPKRYQRQS